jgi:hypothetical protein
MLEDPAFWTLFAICLPTFMITIALIFSEKAFDPPPGLKGIRIPAGEKYRLIVLSVSPKQAEAGYYIAILKDPTDPGRSPRIDRWMSRDDLLVFRARPAGDLVVCALTRGPNGELLEVPLITTSHLSVEPSWPIR